jgi:CRISPR/Cas system CSM-associated protein Csm3 (group 7 of RAMP superfamily)
MDKSSVIGKLLFQGEIMLESPLIIGGGLDNDGVDISVLKNSDGKAYIPATSLAGALRHYFYNNADLDTANKEINQQLKYFWGDGYDNDKESESDRDMYQSALFISDAYAKENNKNKENAKIRIRDGVKISEKGTAEDKAKFDYEVVERGATFNLKLEVNLRQEYNEDKNKTFEKTLVFLIRALEKGAISIGAMTTKGFGRCRLVEGKYYKLDFRNGRDVLYWLSGKWNDKMPEKLEALEAFDTKGGDFVIDSWFSIKNSLIVRSYPGNPEDPDAVHISDSRGYVLPGTSVRGAVRHRAKRIIKTLGGNEESLIKQLFGDVSKKPKEKIKSRVTVDETQIKEGIISETQSRIKIDRFTGGTVGGDLFDTMPLWPKKPGSKMVNLRFSIKNWKKGIDDWQAGLLLLVLKDLWCGDLAIGGEKGIGRGVLEGQEARITFEGQSIDIVRDKGQEDCSRISVTSPAGDNNAEGILQGFVKDLVAKCNGGECHAG